MSSITVFRHPVTRVFLLSILTLFLFTPQVQAQEPLPVTEFPISDCGTYCSGRDVTLGPDGNLWYVVADTRTNDDGYIVRATPQGETTLFRTSVVGAGPHRIAVGPDHNLWFTGIDMVGRIMLDGTITEFPTLGGYLTDIISGTDGNLWFAMYGANNIARMTIDGMVTTFPLPIADSGIDSLAVGTDGNVWFTEGTGKRIGRITTSGFITEFSLPEGAGHPTRITVGPDGNLWFVTNVWTDGFGTNKVGRITPAGVITEFPTPMESIPWDIVAGPDGALWYSDDDGNNIGRVTFDGASIKFSLAVDGGISAPFAVVVGPDGNLWMTQDTNSIVRITLPQTASSSKTPVLFIPGIMGTEMKKGDTLLWADIDGMIGSVGVPFVSRGDQFMNPLAYNSNGIPSDTVVTVSNIISKKTDSFPFHYNFDYTTGLTNEFISRGYSTSTDFLMFPYDWRKDIADVADHELATRIDMLVATSPTGKLDIIAHSQGGLLIKKLLLDHPEYKSKVHKLIFLGTPNFGAPKAAKGLLYGDDYGVSAYGISFLDPEESKFISHNMPSSYELLPSLDYFNTAGGYFTIDGDLLPTHTQTMAKLKELGLNSVLLDNATVFHSSALDHMDFTGSGIDVTNIVGCGKATPGTIVKRSFGRSSIGYVAGDGTVPVVSATGVRGATRTLYGWLNTFEHASMPSNTGVRMTMADIITGTGYEGTLAFSSSPTSCDLSGHVFSVHSPVSLNIYDTEGNHVGVAEDGGLEANIPGSSYDELGEEKFAFVPEGSYTVKLNAIDNGSFSFFSSKIENNETVSIASYLDIPITSTSKAEIVTNDTNTQTIALDMTGQGIATTTITPTAVLTGSSTDDITPPVTTLIATGTKGTNGWFTSLVVVSLTATDTATGTPSGLEKTEYLLDDDATWLTASTSSLIVATTTTISWYSTDHMGNKESVASTTILIDKQKPSTSTLVLTPVSTSTIKLTWATSTDNTGISGYQLFRATSSSATTTLLATTSATTTTFTNTNLTASTTYWYTIKAFDLAGNISSSSNKVSTTTKKLPVTIFSDGFESALNWTKVGAVTWYTGSPKTGTHSVRLQTTANIDKAISLANYSNITISFTIGANSLDTASENVQALYYNGTSWIVFATIANGSANENNKLNPYTYTLPASMNGKTTFKLRFKINGSATDDYGFVDEVKVSGIKI